MTKDRDVFSYFLKRAEKEPQLTDLVLIEKKKLELAWILREARLKRGISQTDLAKLLGVKKSKIKAIEHGRKLKMGLVFRITHALDVTWTSTFKMETGDTCLDLPKD